MWGFVLSGSVWVAAAFTVVAAVAWLTLPMWIDEYRPLRSEAIKVVCVALAMFAVVTTNIAATAWLSRDAREPGQAFTAGR